MNPSSASPVRVQSIDLARGVAVCLMILSHGVNGVLDFGEFTDWGMVPVHAGTKVASSLFILVFGTALGVAFVPHAGTADWPRRRRRLWIGAVLVLFWYKVLTVVELAHLGPEQVLAALAWRDFPSYVEILGFYAIALAWMPLFLPLWARTPAWLQWASPVLAALLAWALLAWGRFPSPQWQALLVEHPDFYTWGQLSRLPLVLAGLLLGGLLHRHREEPQAIRRLAAVVALAGAASLAIFAAWPGDALGARLDAIARNVGKHPPELPFMVFSVGGAALLLGASLWGGNWLASLLRPVTVIGTAALKAFVFHIVVVFALWRWLFGWLHQVSYGFALSMTLLLIVATAGWIVLTRWVHARS